MNPYQRAEAWHRALGSDWTFEQVLDAHGLSGFIHSSPEVFVMARRITTFWRLDEQGRNCISHPMLSVPTGDCWHVWLLAGDFRAAMAFLPEPLPFVSFHRRDKLRILTLDQAARLCKS